MKKVFLISWFQSENYGTCLQAYATNFVLKNNGIDVIFLDRRRYYSLNSFKFFILKIYRLVIGRTKRLYSRGSGMSYGIYENEHSQKLSKTKEFVSQTYEVRSINSKNDLVEIDSFVDCYLVGSDQMWNPWMLSPHYLLDFIPQKSKKPRYSYAASFGVNNLPEKKSRIYKKYLPMFSKITVREPRAAELIDELCGIKAEVVLDPTLLLEGNEWREFSNQSNMMAKYELKEYVLCYFIGSLEFNHVETVKNLASQLHKKTVLIPMKESDYNISDPDILVIADACAYDFVSLIDNAALVCTDSFHAVVFSFLMNTPFYDFPRFKKGDKYSQEARLQNIMSKFGLDDSYWKKELNVLDIKEHLKCDYTYGYSVLEVERKRSLDILLNMIDGR